MIARIPHRRVAEEDVEIDLAPLLDVVFIMLLFFIVTASFVRETGIGVAGAPAAGMDADAGESSLVLTVAHDNQIWLGARRIDVRSVRSTLERLHATRPQAGLVVRAHEDSATEVFAAIADQAREAGVYDVAITTFRE
ncbi:MAG TPA: biopolymer transporter ExbD [Pseudomonadales bacterium]|nr:biopolymer transporter ExbD [Pseudomonadales bacterium]HNC70117.1 biopolymer transporter ExbD [Pseudomonadales bacterium]